MNERTIVNEKGTAHHTDSRVNYSTLREQENEKKGKEEKLRLSSLINVTLGWLIILLIYISK